MPLLISTPRRRRRLAPRLLLAAMRLLALALAGTVLSAPAALDRLTAPAFADDGGSGR
jgi:hypothetical protein